MPMVRRKMRLSYQYELFACLRNRLKGISTKSHIIVENTVKKKKRVKKILNTLTFFSAKKNKTETFLFPFKGRKCRKGPIKYNKCFLFVHFVLFLNKLSGH